MPRLRLLVLPHTPGHRVSDTRQTVACKFRNLFLKQTKQTRVLSLPVIKIIKGTVAGGDFGGKQARLGRAGPLLQLTAVALNQSDGPRLPVTPPALCQEAPSSRPAWADPAVPRKAVRELLPWKGKALQVSPAAPGGEGEAITHHGISVQPCDHLGLSVWCPASLHSLPQLWHRAAGVAGFSIFLEPFTPGPQICLTTRERQPHTGQQVFSLSLGS